MRIRRTAACLGCLFVSLLPVGIDSTLAAGKNPFGLRTADANGCRLMDGRGFEAPTIVLMAGAYRQPPPGPTVALKVIDVAIEAGCDIHEPDELGFSP